MAAKLLDIIAVPAARTSAMRTVGMVWPATIAKTFSIL